jgi:hypothetical protein
MASRRHTRRFSMAMAALLLASGLAGLGAGTAAVAAAAGCQAWTGTQPPSPGSSSNLLQGVTVLSPCDAWAVGSAIGAGGVSQTLIEHWNGTAWTVAPSPDPGTIVNSLIGVRAVSARDVWAVGYYSSGADNTTMILHWDGVSWKQVQSPSPGSISRLYAVRVVSARDAWAVGFHSTSGSAGHRTLILRWNGSTWRQVASPSPVSSGTEAELYSVATFSGSDAWATGQVFADTGTRSTTLILHWNGRRWTAVHSPSPAHSNELFGVGVSSRTNAWAVGISRGSASGSPSQTLVLHWNGRRWTRVASPNPASTGNDNELDAVTVTGARSAWAVGSIVSGAGQRTLVLRWNGARWARVVSPNPGASSSMFGVSASSDGNVWAVGTFRSVGPSQALAVHCC